MNWFTALTATALVVALAGCSSPPEDVEPAPSPTATAGTHQTASLGPPAGDPDTGGEIGTERSGHAAFVVQVGDTEIRWTTQRLGALRATCSLVEFDGGETGVTVEVPMAHRDHDPPAPRAELTVQEVFGHGSSLTLDLHLGDTPSRVPDATLVVGTLAGTDFGGTVDDLTVWDDGSGVTFDVVATDPELGEVSASGFVTCAR